MAPPGASQGTFMTAKNSKSTAMCRFIPSRSTLIDVITISSSKAAHAARAAVKVHAVACADEKARAAGVRDYANDNWAMRSDFGRR